MGEVVLSDKVNVVEAPDIVISEYIGRVASKCERLSACVVTVRQATCEPVQTPEFDEYVMVLEGQADMKLLPQGHTVHVKAGQGVYLPAGQSVQWSWPDTCRHPFHPAAHRRLGCELEMRSPGLMQSDGSTRVLLARSCCASQLKVSVSMSPRHRAPRSRRANLRHVGILEHGEDDVVPTPLKVFMLRVVFGALPLPSVAPPMVLPIED
eukprot:g34496.t1